MPQQVVPGAHFTSQPPQLSGSFNTLRQAYLVQVWQVVQLEQVWQVLQAVQVLQDVQVLQALQVLHTRCVEQDQ
jgi:hypothetical protein